MSGFLTAYLLAHTATATITATASVAALPTDVALAASPETSLGTLILDAVTVHPTLEQRTRYQRMTPLSLNDDTASEVSYFDQRLRLGAEVGLGAHVKLRWART